VLPPHPAATPFARLGLPLSLHVSDAEVEAAWLQRSRQAHPDRFASRSPAERRAAAEQTAALNDARRILRTGFDRASWLVRHVGIAEPKLPQARLVWFMEVREEAEASPAGRARVVDDAVVRFARVEISPGPSFCPRSTPGDGLKEGHRSGRRDPSRLVRDGRDHLP
jgi:hypothetical protein